MTGDLFSETNESPEKSNWILNSDCSFHMCSARKHFATYQAYDRGNAKMANGMASRIVGESNMSWCKT